MGMHSLQLKSRYGGMLQFSTHAVAEAIQFASTAEAAAFLQDNFPDSVTGSALINIAGWFGGAAVNMQVQHAKTELYSSLAQAIGQRRLFVCYLAEPQRISDAAPVAVNKASKKSRLNKPGGAASPASSQGGNGAASDAAVSSVPGKTASGETVPESSSIAFCGDPIAMCTGEEILELVDFELPGLFPLQFKRTYRSSQCDENLGLGFGWRSNFHLHIVALKDDNDEQLLELHNEEGRRLTFAMPEPGQTSYQLTESLALRLEDNGSLVLLRPDSTHWVFVKGRADDKHTRRWALHQIYDSLGNYLQLYYDRFNRLSRLDYSSKRAIELHYNEAGLLSRIEAVKQTSEGLKALDVTLAQYQYDADADLISATNQAGQTERYNYQGHLLIKRERASGFNHYFSWQGEGPSARCIRNWGDDGYYDYQFSYDDSQRLTVSTDSRGQRWQYLHNELNQLIKKVAPDGATWLYNRNKQGKKVAETAPDGVVTRFYYNELGQLITVEQADGAISHFQYNELGQRVGFTDAEGQHWQREYSAGGLLKSVTQPGGGTRQYYYNQNSQLSKIQHADGCIEQYLWDDDGQLLAKRQGEATTRYSYDKLGRINGIVDAAGLITEYQRNSAGKITAIKRYSADSPEQAVTEQFEYDIAGRLISKTNAQGECTQWQYEGLSQPVAQLQADGSRFDYEYDKERNLTAIMRSDGASYQLEYDAQERPVTLQGFDGRQQQYQYDLCGYISSVTDGSQRQIKLKRDGRGRITEQTALFGQQLASNHFHYDKLGRPLRASNAQRKLRFSYHSCGQLAEYWQDDWRTLHLYDEAARRVGTTLPDGTRLDFRYNEHGHLSQLAVNQQPIMWRSFDIAGRETSREYSSGLQLKQAFDSFSRLTAQQWLVDEQKHSRHYSYSKLHQLLLVTDNQQGDTEYQYNCLNQLVCKTHSADSGQCETHQWDSLGNPIGDEIEVAQDRLLRFRDNQYRYDDSGNQLAVSSPGKRQQREFNGFNQLTALRSVTSNTEEVTRYEYDAYGRRSAKVTASGRTDYLWEANNLVGEYRQGEYRWYIYEPGTNKPLALLADGQLYFYQLDQLGTPLSLTDTENNVVWQAQYSVFGKATVTVNTVDNPIRFQGQYYDSESGLHYNHFRYYDPQTGRFVSQDPIGLLGGINHYQYAPNHINWVDPLGLSCKENAANVFSTQDQAANAALKLANPLSITDNLEYGGLIYRDESGNYGFSGPVKGSDQGVNPHDAVIPDGATLVGDYHTHGDYSLVDRVSGAAIRTGDPLRDEFNSDNFSASDYSGIRADARGISGYRGYLGTPSGLFKVFNPEDGTVSVLKE